MVNKDPHHFGDPEPQKAIGCPFGKCTGKPPKLGLLHSGTEWWVYCKNCASSGPAAHNEVEAVQLWNERNLLASPAATSSGIGSKLAKVILLVISWLILNGCASSPTRDPEIVRVEIHNLTRETVYATLITTAPLFGFPISRNLILQAREVQAFEARRGAIPGEIIFDITTGKGITR